MKMFGLDFDLSVVRVQNILPQSKMLFKFCMHFGARRSIS